LEKDPKFDIHNSTFLSLLKEQNKDKKFSNDNKTLEAQMLNVSENKKRAINNILGDAIKAKFVDFDDGILLQRIGLDMNRAYSKLEDSLVDFSNDQ